MGIESFVLVWTIRDSSFQKAVEVSSKTMRSEDELHILSLPGCNLSCGESSETLKSSKPSSCKFLIFETSTIALCSTGRCTWYFVFCRRG